MVANHPKSALSRVDLAGLAELVFKQVFHCDDSDTLLLPWAICPG
jgi:hypothetical protein